MMIQVNTAGGAVLRIVREQDGYALMLLIGEWHLHSHRTPSLNPLSDYMLEADGGAIYSVATPSDMTVIRQFIEDTTCL